MSTPAKKVPLRKIAAKKTAAKKTAAKAAAKPSTKKTAAKKTAAKKVASKVAAKKVASKKVAAKVASKKVASKAQPRTQTQQQKPQAQTATDKAIVKTDLIGNTLEEMAALSRPKAMTLLTSLGDAVAADSFRMGGLLSTIKDNQWFIDDGYDDFKSWVRENCVFGQRTCAYFIKSYIQLTESGVEWHEVEPLGWAKIKEIAGIVNPSNVDEIRDIGMELTVIQLNEWVREYLRDESDLAPPPDDKEWSTMQFKFHRDQRATVEDTLEKAMKILDTDNKSVGLEAVCLDYLSGGKPRKPNATMLIPVVTDAGWERTAEAIEEVYPNITVKIEKMTESEEEEEPEDGELPEAVDGEIQEEFVDTEEGEEEEYEEEPEPETDELEGEEEAEEGEEYEDEYDEDGNLIEYEEIEVDEDGNEIEYEDYEE